MSGNVWMFSDEIDDEDLEFMSHDYVTYNMACEYYRLGIKPVVRMAHEAGAVYKIGKKVLIRRSIFEAYLRDAEEDLIEEKNMSEQRKIIHDDNNGLDYVLVGDYYIPMLALPEETRPIGYWGMLRKEYLKKHKSGMYSYLLLTGKLDSYLADLNEQAQERYELIEAQMRSAEGVTEKLKAQNPMEWVRQCNNIRNRVQEIVLSELVYV